MLNPNAADAFFIHSHSHIKLSSRISSPTEHCKAGSPWLLTTPYVCNTLLLLMLVMGCNVFYSVSGVHSASARHVAQQQSLRSAQTGGGGSPLEDGVTAAALAALRKRKESPTSLKQDHTRRLSSRYVWRKHLSKEGHEKSAEKAEAKKPCRRKHDAEYGLDSSSEGAGYEGRRADRKAQSRSHGRYYRHRRHRQWLSGRESSSKPASENSRVKRSEKSYSEAAHNKGQTHRRRKKRRSREEEEIKVEKKAEVRAGQEVREWKENEHADKDNRNKEEKRNKAVEGRFFPIFLQPHYYGHPFFWFSYWPHSAGTSKHWKQTHLHPVERVMRMMDTNMLSMFRHPRVQLPFALSYSPTSEQGSTTPPRDACRLTVMLNPLLPMEEVRLYITLPDRKLGLAANSTVKRSEKGKAYFRAYGSETRLQAIASIPEECMLSKKLVEAGLIGWSYDGQAPDGSEQIVVIFPSAAHAKVLLGGKWVTREAYKALLSEKCLEKLTPLEKCLLSGRTRTECDRLKAEANEPEKQGIISSFSNEGYGESEVRLPRFVYA